MASNKKYWKSIEELNPESTVVKPIRNNEFVEELPVDGFLENDKALNDSSPSRRDFLKYLGFTTAVAGLAACEGPVKKTIPYVIQPESIRPGEANYYATTIADGFDFAHVLVKSREGRPIIIEQNKEASFRNSINARVAASVLTLYDSLRAQSPSSKEKPIAWNELDQEVVKQIQTAKASGKKVVLLTETIPSPSTKKIIADFSEKFSGVEHVVYDTVSQQAALSAFNEKYGIWAMPDYDLSKADVIVSFGADFLGDWQGGGYGDGYSKSRIPKGGKMSRHIQFESNMTLSGANADHRQMLKPSEMSRAFAGFYARIHQLPAPETGLSDTINKAVEAAAETFLKARDRAVLLTGIPQKEAQLLALHVNQSVNSQVFDAANPIFIRQGNTEATRQLIQEMRSGAVGVLIMSGVNPVYSMPEQWEFEKALAAVPFSVSFSQKKDETASKATYLAAASHNLESWGDVELKAGHFGLMQPLINPLFNTRQLQDALLIWSGHTGLYRDYLKDFWRSNILKSEDSWEKSLHDGVYANPNPLEIEEKEIDFSSVYASLLNNSFKPQADFELILYTKTGMGDGRQANNAWLQEFPDPITRTSWDNYLTVSKADAERLGIKNVFTSSGALDGSYVRLTVGASSLKVPAIIQPGQAVGTLGLALGYGKKDGLKPEMQTGVNAFLLYNDLSEVQSASVTVLEEMHPFASVQLQGTLAGRDDIVKETTLDVFSSKPKEVWNDLSKVSYDHQETDVNKVDLWDGFDRSIGHHFNLSIDLNACTGCGACVIACHAENNVPVVGKREVRNFRDMHWLRIDRYYSSGETFEDDYKTYEEATGILETAQMFKDLRDPTENPQVAFQPVMCQHCNHAPCETVCPVAATSHGRQGQNQMAYNRCVGTRYCANNCPYKVRRFNWFLYNNNSEFDFYMNDDLGKMVLNPDVVVRSRGVMEKCSLCIQKTQKAILDAKKAGRAPTDEEFQTACTAVCSSGAMVFGDINDKKSEVAKLKKGDRAYYLLDHKGTRPNVFYHVKVRNTVDI